MDSRHVSQFLDGRAGVEHGSRPDVLAPLVQFRQTSIGQTPIKEVRALVKLANRLAIARPPNIMAAQNKLHRLPEIDSFQKRPTRYQSTALQPPPPHPP